MRLIKLALISIVVLFAVITGLAALLPSQIRISRAIDIDAPAATIYPQLADMKAWDKWNEYIRFYHDKQWNGDTLATREITVFITQKSDSLVEADWRQASGNHFASGYRIIARDSLHSSLQWYFDFRLHWYPWEKFQSIVYDGQLGPVIEKSLQNLKQQAEQSQ